MKLLVNLHEAFDYGASKGSKVSLLYSYLRVKISRFYCLQHYAPKTGRGVLFFF